ncbi:hypothetical protein J8273_1301 [Carpediemonas membranifera]|uniref:Uncharacterized protein n=1 Tax=Carpediemonas membranifera TaxID=201153 RepID=A0A8J6E4H6_9EUKA|nr:hypothetical protein J8273_1301 [Carpediemonas membranifera]|eukprot:KAG9396956.1 hypothetical protein J8273_1301 [Carpediemonas membranifera]
MVKAAKKEAKVLQTPVLRSKASPIRKNPGSKGPTKLTRKKIAIQLLREENEGHTDKAIIEHKKTLVDTFTPKVRKSKVGANNLVLQSATPLIALERNDEPPSPVMTRTPTLSALVGKANMPDIQKNASHIDAMRKAIKRAGKTASR